ncbi:hypothetical protein VSS37_03475 [Candidatus Thiothrix sp. Deng01]|uniref:Uncharacterized protein n=1 Tax=Candidatus Thiothrix phosphatis TaxID=3112415 RepID=A0ABU6CTV7_9GAMM|nr:hypothetical protein [Candidatus Thiothrix sp. Deng01]MEB4590031.1 hypothetical protein [Candidatus Thiothrix sp. Deng01]
MSNCPVIAGTNSVGLFSLSVVGGNITSTLPLDNLKNPWRGRPARITTTATTVEIKGTSPSAITCSLLALVGHDLGYYRQITVKLYSGQNQTGTLLYNSGAMQSNRGDGTSIGDASDLWVYFPAVTCFSFTITITGVPVGGLINIQHMILDNALQLARGFDSRALSFRFFERAKLLTTSAGSGIPENGQKRIREFTWTFPALDATDRMLLEMLEVASTGQLFYVVSFPEGSSREKLLLAMMCRLQGDVVYHSTGRGANNAVTLAFREA